MDRLTNLILDLEKEMKIKKIKKGELYKFLDRVTVAKIFNKYEGNISSLRKIIEYVDKR